MKKQLKIKEILNIVRNTLNRLSPRDKKMMCERLGIQFQLPKTLQAVADESFITRERVRQIEVATLKDINTQLNY